MFYDLFSVADINDEIHRKKRPGLSPVARERYTCPTCKKLYMGQQKLLRHYNQYPKHFEKAVAAELKSGSLSKLLAAKTSKAGGVVKPVSTAVTAAPGSSTDTSVSASSTTPLPVTPTESVTLTATKPVPVTPMEPVLNSHTDGIPSPVIDPVICNVSIPTSTLPISTAAMVPILTAATIQDSSTVSELDVPTNYSSANAELPVADMTLIFPSDRVEDKDNGKIEFFIKNGSDTVMDEPFFSAKMDVVKSEGHFKQISVKEELFNLNNADFFNSSDFSNVSDPLLNGNGSSFPESKMNIDAAASSNASIIQEAATSNLDCLRYSSTKAEVESPYRTVSFPPLNSFAVKKSSVDDSTKPTPRKTSPITVDNSALSPTPGTRPTEINPEPSLPVETDCNHPTPNINAPVANVMSSNNASLSPSLLNASSSSNASSPASSSETLQRSKEEGLHIKFKNVTPVEAVQDSSFADLVESVGSHILKVHIRKNLDNKYFTVSGLDAERQHLEVSKALPKAPVMLKTLVDSPTSLSSSVTQSSALPNTSLTSDVAPDSVEAAKKSRGGRHKGRGRCRGRGRGARGAHTTFQLPIPPALTVLDNVCIVKLNAFILTIFVTIIDYML